MSLSVRLHHRFPSFTLDATFDAPPGVTALFGRSGSGKTTVINAVAGLLRADIGHIALEGRVLFDTQTRRNLPPHRRRIGYVFQEGRLFPHLTVRQNLLYGRWFSRTSDGVPFDRVVDLLGIAPLLERRPAALSGGEKQRVAIGRALLSNPGLLLMDEPLAALDDARKAEILPYLERLRDQTATPILYVSHSMAEVARLATTLVVMDAGRVLRTGPASAILSDPDAAPLFGLREAGAYLTARIAAHEADGLTSLYTSAGPMLLPRIDAAPGTALRVRVHAQDVILSRDRPVGLSALNILPATVTTLRLGDGPGALVQLQAGSDLLLARITRRSAAALTLAPGTPVFAILKSVSVARDDVGTGQAPPPPRRTAAAPHLFSTPKPEDTVTKEDPARAVPTGRLTRLLHMGGIAGGVAGGIVAGGLRQLAAGQRPDLAQLALTPANALRVTQGLSHMRGAALKLGQMLSMDTGVVLPPDLTRILASLRDDARHMPPKQLQTMLNAEWGSGWRARFTRFDVRPFAAASIGQVHRATTADGRDLAIKVQYPGVRASIDSDIDNMAGFLRLPGLTPQGMDLNPLLAEAKRQLHDEADYETEAAHLSRFHAWLTESDRFAVPALHADLSTPQVLAMTYMPGQPIDTLAEADQTTRDHTAAALIELTLRELFEFGAMQTDPNLANYRHDPATGRIVLLDYGAVRTIAPETAAAFRALMTAGLDADREATASAMLRIGYFGPQTAVHHRDLILRMFETAMVPLRDPHPFDFGTSNLLDRLRHIGLAIGTDRDLLHVPPAQTLFLHRKIGGMYLLATKLRARVALRPLLDRYR